MTHVLHLKHFNLHNARTIFSVNVLKSNFTASMKNTAVAHYVNAFSALMLLVGRQKGARPVKTEWQGAGMVICLERGAYLHMAQLMPLPLTVSCVSKIEIGFTFLVLDHLGSPGKRAVKGV